ncbi:MAG: toprim domain-containing protein [Candidatus Staskawiczbacteria bacterium]|nr:toprim domain-containing protein [Candidatus Staskawiczbacteria bacterium]
MRIKIPEIERDKLVELAGQCLLSQEGKVAIDYLKSDVRHFDDAAIKMAVEKFKIGYIPDNVLNINGTLHEFAGRIIMPVYNTQDELVALSSRDFRPNAKIKFFHESFAKRNILYGLNVAKKHIIKRKMAIIVEGEFDVQYLHYKGFDFAVGVLGSALGLSHIATLSRYCREIFVVLDGDKAGQVATKKIIDSGLSRKINALQYYNISIIPVLLPEKTDPDEFIYKNDNDAFISLLRQSRKNSEEKIKEMCNGF